MNALPQHPRAFLAAVLLGCALFAVLSGCDNGNPNPDPAPFDPNPSDNFNATFGPEFVPSSFVATITNPYYPLTPGTTFRYEGDTEEGREVIIFEVLDETRQVAGVTARVVRDRAYIDGELIEDTVDWFAQDEDGNVWYLGEETCEYVDGECVDTGGSWEAGMDGARAGIVMPADPAAGQRYYQEYYDGEAEDRAEVLSTAVDVTIGYGAYTDCVQTYDTTPIQPEVEEHKYYCAGVGQVRGVNLENDEEVELVSVTEPEDAFAVTYTPPFNTATFVTDITNPYFALVPGTTFRYEKDTPDGRERVVVEVTTDTREILGVTTRVVRDRVYLAGELVEDTFDWFAQDAAGNVWYFGEETCEYEDGVCVNTAGSFEAGVDGALAGIVMPANPTVGQAYYQERYLGEAEDRAVVLSTNASVNVEFGSFTGCVQTFDSTPLDPLAREHKFYCAGVGTALEVDLETGERLELIEVTP